MDKHLYEELIYSFENLTDEDSFDSWIEIYIEDAYYSSNTYDILFSFSQYLYSKRFIEYQYFVLEHLHKINSNQKVSYSLAMCSYLLGNLEKGLYWLHTITDSKKTYKALKLEADILFHQGDFLSAKEILLLLIQKFPTKPYPYDTLARIYDYQNIPDKAIYYYNIVYKYFKKYSRIRDVRMNIIKLLIQSEIIDFNEINLLINDSELSLQTVDEFNQIAQIYLSINNYTEALKYINKSLELNSENMQAQVLLLEVYIKTESINKIEKQIEWLINNLPAYHELMSEVIVLVSHTKYMNKKLLDLSKQHLTLISDVDDKIVLVKSIVLYYLQQNRANFAIDFLNSLNDPQLNDINLSYFYAISYQSLDNFDRAVKNFDLALEHLIAEKSLVNSYVSYLIKHKEIDKAKYLANKYYQSFYDNKELKLLRVDLNQ